MAVPIVPVAVLRGAADRTLAWSLKDMAAAEGPEAAFPPGSGCVLCSVRDLAVYVLSRKSALPVGFVTLRREAAGS